MPATGTQGAREAKLVRRRIYILPTRQGLLFGLILLSLLAGSVNYNNSLGYAFTFLLAGIATVSILHTYRTMAGLGLAAGVVPPAFAGQDAAFEILVTNPTARARHGLRFRSRGRERDVPVVRAAEMQPVILKSPAERRGVMPLGRFTVTTTFPLGLFYAWSHVELDARCIVYPRPGPPRPMPEGAVRDDEDGDRGRGTGDFVGFRTYWPGDSLHHVYWKGVARGGEMVTKQFGGGLALDLWFDYDALPDLESEARLSQLCRWILDAHRNEQPYGLRLPGVEHGVSAGESHKHRCLEALARF